ncbi:PaaX family transcriptional regulator C-terminal domain-containing protein [Streptomyces virginiae]
MPAELLPADWNAVAARQIFQQLNDVPAAPALRHVEEVTALPEETARP